MGDTYTVTSSPRGAGPEGRPLDLAESCSYLHLQPRISSAQLFLVVTGSQSHRQEALRGHLVCSPSSLPLFKHSRATLDHGKFFFFSLATSQRSPRP